MDSDAANATGIFVNSLADTSFLVNDLLRQPIRFAQVLMEVNGSLSVAFSKIRSTNGSDDIVADVRNTIRHIGGQLEQAVTQTLLQLCSSTFLYALIAIPKIFLLIVRFDRFSQSTVQLGSH